MEGGRGEGPSPHPFCTPMVTYVNMFISGKDTFFKTLFYEVETYKGGCDDTSKNCYYICRDGVASA